MNINFQFLKATTLTQRTALKAFLEKTINRQSYKLENLIVVFCSDDKLLKINQIYLNKNYYTDIITFDLSDHSNSINGELFISVDRVRENAKTFKSSFREELHRVIFHGVLHLLGYNDKTSAQSKKIRAMEDAWLTAYFKKG